MTRIVGVALLLGAVWFIGSLGSVQACKCVVPGSPTEEMAKFDAVFAGHVVSVSHSFDPNVTPYKPGDRTTVGLDVSTVWKGVVHERMYITTPPTGGSCGFAFSEGEQYIVYASTNASEDGGYQASICSRTALLGQAQADLDALGEGRAPRAGTAGPQPEQSQDSFATGLGVALLVTVVAVLLLGGTLAYASRRRR
ncbi:MAG: hypothetical protein OXG64_08855 [Chloroflexi bacterium]|nr:hypothetical protein [Chloroflexota bacterium]